MIHMWFTGKKRLKTGRYEKDRDSIFTTVTRPYENRLKVTSKRRSAKRKYIKNKSILQNVTCSEIQERQIHLVRDSFGTV
jgi:hypothetical protein